MIVAQAGRWLRSHRLSDRSHDATTLHAAQAGTAVTTGGRIGAADRLRYRSGRAALRRSSRLPEVAADRRIGAFDNEFAAYARSDADARRLATIPGIGVLN